MHKDKNQHHQILATTKLELLALDLSSCDRCKATERNLEQARHLLTPVLDLMGVALQIDSIVVTRKEQANDLQFAISPTVRINGADLAMESRESDCETCSEMCDCPEGTKCRVWVHRGEEFNAAPVALIVEAILREVVRGLPQVLPNAEPEPYSGVPDNLVRFFDTRTCCSPSEMEECCASEEQNACCGEDKQVAGCCETA